MPACGQPPVFFFLASGVSPRLRWLVFWNNVFHLPPRPGPRGELSRRTPSSRIGASTVAPRAGSRVRRACASDFRGTGGVASIRRAQICGAAPARWPFGQAPNSSWRPGARTGPGEPSHVLNGEIACPAVVAVQRNSRWRGPGAVAKLGNLVGAKGNWAINWAAPPFCPLSRELAAPDAGNSDSHLSSNVAPDSAARARAAAWRGLFVCLLRLERFLVIAAAAHRISCCQLGFLSAGTCEGRRLALLRASLP